MALFIFYSSFKSTNYVVKLKQTGTAPPIRTGCINSWKNGKFKKMKSIRHNNNNTCWHFGGKIYKNSFNNIWNHSWNIFNRNASEPEVALKGHHIKVSFITNPHKSYSRTVSKLSIFDELNPSSYTLTSFVMWAKSANRLLSIRLRCASALRIGFGPYRITVKWDTKMQFVEKWTKYTCVVHY